MVCDAWCCKDSDKTEQLNSTDYSFNFPFYNLLSPSKIKTLFLKTIYIYNKFSDFVLYF